MHYAAITTKVLPQTETKPRRIKATCKAGSITRSLDWNGKPEDEHKAIAAELAAKFEWDGSWHGGAMPDGNGYCFVLTTSYSYNKTTNGEAWHKQSRAFEIQRGLIV